MHSSGADLDQVEAFLAGQGDARVLDLGCGGGHVAYRAAPKVREVVACDLTADMLAQVQRTAAERGLANIVTQQAAGRKAALRRRLLRHRAVPVHGPPLGECRSRPERGAPGVEAAGPGLVHRCGRARAPAARHASANARTVARPLACAQLFCRRMGRDAGAGRLCAVGLTARKLRMEFPVWTARTNTPQVFVDALRAFRPRRADRSATISPSGRTAASISTPWPWSWSVRSLTQAGASAQSSHSSRWANRSRGSA